LFIFFIKVSFVSKFFVKSLEVFEYHRAPGFTVRCLSTLGRINYIKFHQKRGSGCALSGKRWRKMFDLFQYSAVTFTCRHYRKPQENPVQAK
jgi:hypothetical protein